MEKFIKITDTAVPLEMENVDTDQIIPARFLKATDKAGFADNLFRDWRFDKNDQIIPTFPLNKNKYSGSILVACNNFGCGSSREHAAWALKGYGFEVVISSYFADILRVNSLNNGLLPVQVSPEFLLKLFAEIKANPSVQISLVLQNQKVEIPSAEKIEHFDIDPYKKTCMINGYDDIDFLVSKLETIKNYEKLNAACHL